MTDGASERDPARRLLRLAARDLPRTHYLRHMLDAVGEPLRCSTVEIWLRGTSRITHCRRTLRPTESFTAEHIAPVHAPAGARPATTTAELGLAVLAAEPPQTTVSWRPDRTTQLVIGSGDVVHEEVPAGSLAVVPLAFADRSVGVLVVWDDAPDSIGRSDAELLGDLAPVIASTAVTQRAQAALHERVKELTCLYGLSQVASRPGAALSDIFADVVELLPPAWQHPDIASARIVVDGREYRSSGFDGGPHRQAAAIVVDDRLRGYVEVTYSGALPGLDGDPFLDEERDLIDAIARQLAFIIERQQAAEERGRLERQLRHADRLATIGELAAGVAHEINEPLGNILGFAQLAARQPGNPQQTSGDLEKIITASLFAREIVRKLMLFARQTQPAKSLVDLNAVVEQGLFFLESRFARQGTVLVRDLQPDLPPVTADPSQLHQVLVNLVVNALQATPGGGTVAIRTRADDASVVLTVEDTGAGIPQDIQERIFLPFFTTKDVDQGTGLGLSVVHGIVTAHAGSVRVTSAPGEGSRFEVELPRTSEEPHAPLRR